LHTRAGKEQTEVVGQGAGEKDHDICARAIRYAGIDLAPLQPGAAPRMKRAFYKARFGFIDRAKQMVVEAVSVEAVGGGAKFNEKKMKEPR
jgi:5-oxoprolinase (ATP-hydrolysing)